MRDDLNLPDAVFDARVRVALATVGGPVTARNLCDTAKVPLTSHASWSRALKRLAARGEVEAKPLRQGAKTCLSNPMYYRLLPETLEENVNDTTETKKTNGQPSEPGWYPQPRNLATAPQPEPEQADEPGPPENPAIRRRTPSQRFTAAKHREKLLGVLTHEPLSATQIYRAHYEGRSPSGQFLAALRKMAEAGEVKLVPRAGITKRPTFGDCDLFSLPDGAPAPLQKTEAEKLAAARDVLAAARDKKMAEDLATKPAADLERAGLVETAKAAHQDWEEAKSLLRDAAARAKDAAWAVFRHDQGLKD